jgi:hypothetical protein
MIFDVTSNGNERSPSRWRAFLVGGPLTPEKRRWRLRRFGVLALIGVGIGLVGLLLVAVIPRGSSASPVAAALVGLGGGIIVVTGLGVGADRLR